MKEWDKTVYARKELAIEKVKDHFMNLGEDPHYLGSISPFMEKAIEFYINPNSKKCVECKQQLTNRNRSGYCRDCYKKIYNKTPERRKKINERKRQRRMELKLINKIK